MFQRIDNKGHASGYNAIDVAEGQSLPQRLNLL